MLKPWRRAVEEATDATSLWLILKTNKMYTLSQEVFFFFGNTNELLTKEEWLIHMINSCYKKDTLQEKGAFKNIVNNVLI